MKPTAAKFTVAQLAKMMGKPAKEVLFLLQGIGVDVKTADSVLDPATATAILTGKTQAPKTLIVRQTPAAPSAASLASAAAAKAKTERAALKRIKIVEKAPEAEAVETAGIEAPGASATGRCLQKHSLGRARRDAIEYRKRCPRQPRGAFQRKPLRRSRKRRW